MATYEELLQRARTIKTESSDRANTAVRVGSWMVDVLDYIKNGLDGKADDRYEELTTLAKTVEGAINEINSNPSLSGEVLERIEQEISAKQDVLVAGSGIRISGNVISATGGGGGGADWGEIGGTMSDQTDLQEALDGKASSTHSHAISDVTNLQSALNGKQATLTFDDTPTAGSSNPVKSSGVKSALDGKADSSHSHSISDVANLQTTLNGKQDTLTAGQNITIVDNVISATGGGTGSANWGSIGGTMSDQTDLKQALDGKANSSHTHQQSDVSGLSTALAGKADSLHSHSISEVTNLQPALDDKVTLSSDLSFSAPAYSASNVGKYAVVLSIPTNRRLTLTVSSNANGYGSSNVVYLVGGSQNSSAYQLLGDGGFAIRHDIQAGKVYLCVPCLSSQYAPRKTYNAQVLFYSESDRTEIVVPQTQTIYGSDWIDKAQTIYTAPLKDTEPFNVSSAGVGSIDLENYSSFLGKCPSEMDSVTIHVENELAGQIYNLTFDRDVTGGITIDDGLSTPTVYCAISESVKAGDVITLTAASNTSNGWIYSHIGAPIESPDGSILVEISDGVTKLSVNRNGLIEWGDISGTLSDQTDLREALDGKADKVISGGLLTGGIEAHYFAVNYGEFSGSVGTYVPLFVVSSNNNGKSMLAFEVISREDNCGYYASYQFSTRASQPVKFVCTSYYNYAATENLFTPDSVVVAQINNYSWIICKKINSTNYDFFVTNETIKDVSYASIECFTTKSNDSKATKVTAAISSYSGVTISAVAVPAVMVNPIKDTNYSAVAQNVCVVLAKTYMSSRYFYSINNPSGIGESSIEAIFTAYYSHLNSVEDSPSADSGYEDSNGINIRIVDSNNKYLVPSQVRRTSTGLIIKADFFFTESDVDYHHVIAVTYTHSASTGSKVSVSYVDMTDWFGTQAQYDALTDIIEGRNYYIINS